MSFIKVLVRTKNLQNKIKVNKYPSTYKQYNEPGLNGLFGWLRRKINKIAEFIAPVFPRLSSILDDFSNGDGSFFGVEFGTIGNRSRNGEVYQNGSLPLSPLDEANLDNWFENNFEPYFRSILQNFQNFKTNLPSVEEFVVFYNEVSMLAGYFAAQIKLDTQNGVDGLSFNAVLTRSEFLDIQAETLKRSLDEFVSEKGLEVSQRRVTLNINTSKYSSLGFNSPEVLSIKYGEVSVLNGSTIDYTEVDQTNTPISEITNSKGNTGRNLVIAVVAGYFISKLVNN